MIKAHEIYEWKYFNSKQYCKSTQQNIQKMSSFSRKHSVMVLKMRSGHFLKTKEEIKVKIFGSSSSVGNR
jgi:hypothetical protein